MSKDEAVTYRKTVIQVEVLSVDDTGARPESSSLYAIASEGEGGAWSIMRHTVSTEVVDVERMRTLLEEQGSDPELFMVEG